MPGQHARFAPSAAHRWMTCTGSLALCDWLPRGSDDTEYSREGTRAHEAAAEYLTAGAFPLDTPVEMADALRAYVDAIERYAVGGELLVERRVDFSDFVGIPGQTGTADAIILHPGEIQLHDLKFGRGVQVYADNNEQLMLYALGALNEFDLAGDVTRARLFIHQPRLDHLHEWEVSVEDLLVFAERAKIAAARAQDFAFSPSLSLDFLRQHLKPGEKQCRFCPAKAVCPVLAADVTQTVFGDFDDLDKAQPLAPPDLPAFLGVAMGKLGMVEDWAKAVRAEVERRLLASEAVPGWKLVQGRKPARDWSSEQAAEEALKSMRLKMEEMYSMKLISPAAAEKILTPRRWKKIQPLITQGEPKLSVAPESDKRPAASPPQASKDDFTDHTQIDDLI